MFPKESADLIDLLDKLLQFDPRKRLTAEQALGHPYLKLYHGANSASVPPPTDIAMPFEAAKPGVEQMRELVWQVRLPPPRPAPPRASQDRRLGMPARSPLP